MSRNTGSVWKKSRRLGFSVLETGEELTRRNTIPGQHGNARRPKLPNYGIQLQEKQRIRHNKLTTGAFCVNMNSNCKQR